MSSSMEVVMTVETAAQPVGPSGSAADGVDSPVGSQDTVSHESFKKVLAEKKAMQAKLAEYQAEHEAREQAALVEQKKFEDLWKAEESKRKKAEELIEGIRLEKQNDTKRKAVLAEFGLKREEFLKFVDLDSIPLDSEGNLDLNSVKQQAAEFKAKFPELVVEHKAPPPTSTAPASFGTVKVDLKDPKALLDVFKQTRK